MCPFAHAGFYLMNQNWAFECFDIGVFIVLPRLEIFAKVIGTRNFTGEFSQICIDLANKRSQQIGSWIMDGFRVGRSTSRIHRGLDQICVVDLTSDLGRR